MAENGIDRIPKTNKWKKGEGKKFLKILEEFVNDYIKICQPKLE